MNIFLIDADNLSAPSWVDEACQSIEATFGSISVRRAYGSAENLRGLSDVLRTWAIRPFVNLSLTKNTTDLALAVDAMELACQTPRPTMLAIGSGDADFVPLVVRLRERGIKTICISESGKMAQEAARAYDEVIFVGARSDQARQKVQSAVAIKAKTEVVPAKKVGPKKTSTTPSRQAATKTAPAKKTAAVKSAVHKTMDAASQLTVAQILDAAPALRTGQLQRLADIVKSLHEAKLLGKNAASTRLFNRFPKHFELTPTSQPNQVRYTPPLK
jgi:hypothetical protein